MLQTPFTDVLDRLHIQRGDLVFLHTSFVYVRTIVTSPLNLVEQLLDRLGSSGTLVMPRYSWNLDSSARPWKGYADYYRLLPLMNLQTTPVNIGVVPEVFRQMQGIEMSVSHFWPLSAVGDAAARLLAGQEYISHAYGPDSCFSRLLDADAKILGLGVTLNTSSIAPVTDYRLGIEMSSGVFSSLPLDGEIVDQRGNRHICSVKTLTPSAVKLFRPTNILGALRNTRKEMQSFSIGNSNYFCYPASLYHESAMAAVHLADLNDGRQLPWFDKLLAPEFQ